MTISLAAHAEAVEPDVLVKNIAEDVLAVIRQNQANQAGGQEEILKLVNAKVLPHFDFERMTRLAVGRNWRKATPKQKNTLVAEFRNLLVNTYTNAFTRYQNQTVKVTPVERPAGVNEITVKTLILEPGAQRIAVDYEMEKTPDGWKVFDLRVEGVSLVIVYRSTFTREVRMSGIDGLIKTLAEKNAANNAAH
jgi:phospholipid transport system substrate-binding protein